MSDNVLYYAPSEGYWNQKVLMLQSVDTLGRKNTALTELLVQGKVSRMVTENTQQGTYRASHKAINGTFSFISATAKGCQGILKADNVIALPLQEPDALAEAITDREIRKHAGLTDQAKEDKAIRLLQFLFRELKTVKVINPHLEQLDITGLFKRITGL
ncbi:hypothetical protein Q763_17605 [Flavobacterium beibuense F44-8]|uniref:Uncharacterized protein n=1 Tax=Flavobacterium beibuense F44-8 TaxID=1406840 RepID=A0A0A2LHF8_9FLAO|nr:hypothetical protein [Flavobacterium beibuense]KGO78603.1 hypothetical protein Q763_17605 [Flavobacterium beibuense F44-8]